MAVMAEIMKTLDCASDGVVVVDDAIRLMIQRRLLETLDDILDICNTYCIRYHMGGGSALGALRHKGFIPWDDDIDINMERAELDRFLVYFREKYSDKYWIRVPGEELDYDYMMVQISAKDVYARELMQVKSPHLGLLVDVFAVENAPDNSFFRRIHGMACMGLRYALSCIRFGENREELLRIAGGDSRLARFIAVRSRLARLFLVLPKRVWVRWCDKCARLCRNNHSKYVVIPSGQKQYFKEMYPRDRYCATVEADFEGRTVQMTSYAHEYMTNLFGDYMKLPPEEKRGRHVFLELDIEALKRGA